MERGDYVNVNVGGAQKDEFVDSWGGNGMSHTRGQWTWASGHGDDKSMTKTHGMRAPFGMRRITFMARTFSLSNHGNKTANLTWKNEKPTVAPNGREDIDKKEDTGR